MSEEFMLKTNDFSGDIIFHVDGISSEILRLSPDGFYVRGIKLEQDENEARQVFEAFMDWMRQVNLYRGP